MRIIVLGGLAHSLLNFRGPLLKTLVERGHEVIACAPDAPPKLRAALADFGVRYRHITLARAGRNPWADLRTYLALRCLFREVRPDLVLAYTVKPVIYSGLVGRSVPDVRIFAMIEGLGYAFGALGWRQWTIGYMVRRLYRIALKSSSGVFFLNPDDRELFLNLGMLPNGVETTLLNGIGVDLDWYQPCDLPNEPVFLLIARLLADKGLREFHRAARRLKGRYPRARFLLAGDLDPNPMSISAAELASWQADGTLEYLGQLDDVRPAFAAARVYVLPSYREGTPRTVLEAMAMGRPIVTTDAPGCRETVVDGVNGFLVPVRDDMALERAMERFILEPELAGRMGAESLQLAREKYDVHKVNEVILSAMGLD